MRIGLVTDFYYPWIAGPATLLRNFGHGLAARGHNVSLLAPSPTGAPFVEQDGAVTVTRVRTVPSPFGHGLRVAPSPGRAVAAWLEATRPDVVHVHHPFPICTAAIFIARGRGIPVVATNHTIPECSLYGIRHAGRAFTVANAGLGRWIAALLSRCAAVATPTATAADLTRGLGYRGRIHVISNGVDTQRFAPGRPSAELRRKFGLDDRPVVLYTGRLDAEKEMDVWLRAAAKALQRTPIRFLVGGRGSERVRLEALVAALGLGDTVTFIDYLAEDEFPEIYRAADVYFITSPVELQSIGTLEAAASALPVVAVRAGALPELIRDGENGFLVPMGDSDAAAAHLVQLAEDRRLRQRFGVRSRVIAAGHDLRESVKAYEDLLVHASLQHQGERTRERVALSR